MSSRLLKDDLVTRIDRLRYLAREALAHADRWALPEKAAELIEKHPEVQVAAPEHREVEGSTRPEVVPGYVLCTATGEVVPGTAVTLAQPQVTLRIDKPVREAELARVRAALGW